MSVSRRHTLHTLFGAGAASAGGVVYLPGNRMYRTTSTLVVTASNVVLRGDGPTSAIAAYHGGDTIRFEGGINDGTVAAAKKVIANNL